LEHIIHEWHILAQKPHLFLQKSIKPNRVLIFKLEEEEGAALLLHLL